MDKANNSKKPFLNKVKRLLLGIIVICFLLGAGFSVVKLKLSKFPRPNHTPPHHPNMKPKPLNEIKKVDTARNTSIPPKVNENRPPLNKPLQYVGFPNNDDVTLSLQAKVADLSAKVEMLEKQIEGNTEVKIINKDYAKVLNELHAFSMKASMDQNLQDDISLIKAIASFDKNLFHIFDKLSEMQTVPSHATLYAMAIQNMMKIQSLKYAKETNTYGLFKRIIYKYAVIVTKDSKLNQIERLIKNKSYPDAITILKTYSDVMDSECYRFVQMLENRVLLDRTIQEAHIYIAHQLTKTD